MSVLTVPAHGAVRLAGASLAVGDGFSVDDLEAGTLAYSHDGSAFATDSFSIALGEIAGADRTVNVPASIEDITTNGLVLNLDAATASVHHASYPEGCSALNEIWKGFFGAGLDALIQGFGACVSTTLGWQGSGAVADPARLVLDGTDAQYGEVPDDATLQSQDLSLEAWVNWGGGGDSVIFHKWNWCPGQYALQVQGGQVCLVVDLTGSGQSSHCFPAALTAGQWSHVLATYDHNAGQGVVYVNGIASVSPAGQVFGNFDFSCSTPLGIGHREDIVSCPGCGPGPGHQAFSGAIARAAVYNRVLSSSEVQQNCRASQARFVGPSICP